MNTTINYILWYSVNGNPFHRKFTELAHAKRELDMIRNAETEQVHYDYAYIDKVTSKYERVTL